MSVWLCIPSARPVEEVNARMGKWRAMGYRIALHRDGDGFTKTPDADLCIVHPVYPGYAMAANHLVERVMDTDRSCDWVVLAGDDTDPDPTKRADEIAAECSEHFQARWEQILDADPGDGPMAGRSDLVHFVRGRRGATFGVMQPTGDPWRDLRGRIIERIAGSPWLGREWCRRAYGGNGPLFAGYTHCFADEELQCVAERLGVFWQRPDLIHHHDHWARPRGNAADMPAFLAEATSAEHWAKYSALFAERKAAGFPGSEPIA